MRECQISLHQQLCAAVNWSEHFGSKCSCCPIPHPVKVTGEEHLLHCSLDLTLKWGLDRSLWFMQKNIEQHYFYEHRPFSHCFSLITKRKSTHGQNADCKTSLWSLNVQAGWCLNCIHSFAPHVLILLRQDFSIYNVSSSFQSNGDVRCISLGSVYFWNSSNFVNSSSLIDHGVSGSITFKYSPILILLINSITIM